LSYIYILLVYRVCWEASYAGIACPDLSGDRVLAIRAFFVLFFGLIILGKITKQIATNILSDRLNKLKLARIIAWSGKHLKVDIDPKTF